MCRHAAARTVLKALKGQVISCVEAPTDMIDQLGGWALKSVGQGYGDGYDLELLIKYLTKITGR